MSDPGWEGAEEICDSNHQPPTTQDDIETILIPTDYIWMLAEIGNIAPGKSECSGGSNTIGFSATWFVERDGLTRGQWDEVCFLTYQEDKITAGFNNRFIDKYRTEYFAILGITNQYLSEVEWIDYAEPKVLKNSHLPLTKGEGGC
tara:strand:- start:1139 stop:1576 length:438 start_codon:yes stop_codon:yes gene_type:complete